MLVHLFMTDQENLAVLLYMLRATNNSHTYYTDICGEIFARGSGYCVFITNDLCHQFSLGQVNPAAAFLLSQFPGPLLDQYKLHVLINVKHLVCIIAVVNSSDLTS